MIEGNPASFGGLTWALSGPPESRQACVTAGSSKTGKFEYSGHFTDFLHDFLPPVHAAHV